MVLHRAERMLGGDVKQIFLAAMQSDVSVSLNVCRNNSVLNMKRTSLWLRSLYWNYYGV